MISVSSSLGDKTIIVSQPILTCFLLMINPIKIIDGVADNSTMHLLGFLGKGESDAK